MFEAAKPKGLLPIGYVAALALFGCGPASRQTEAGGRGNLVVGVAPAARRVARTENLDATTKAVELSAARNEFEPFQVVVRAEGGP